MQSVAYLDEDNADVITHGKQQFLEVLSLCRSPISEDTTADLGQSVYDLSNLFAKDVLYIFNGIVGIFNDIMEQGSADAGRTKPHFLASYLCNSDRMHDIRFSRESSDTLMCLSGKVESLGDDIHFLAMS